MTVENGFIALSILMTIILLFFGNHIINKTFDKKKNKKLMLFFGLFFWLFYNYELGKSEILTDFSFPPRFVLLLIIPAFTFIGFFLYQNRKNKWIQNIPTSWLTLYQSFRIVIESLFVLAVAKGILHKEVTFEGYNYDILFAFSAIVVGLLVFKFKVLGEKALLYWNYFGLFVIAIILFLFFTTLYFPQLYGSEMALIPKDFGTFPFVLVPGFLMPSAVFIHVLSVFQLKNKD